MSAAHSPENDAPDFDRCFRSWPDPNSVRNHVCIQWAPHQCSCGVCGPSVIPPAVTSGEVSA